MVGARGRSKTVGLVLALWLAMDVPSAGNASFLERPETLTYQWQLEGISSVIARVLRVFPTRGDGLMKLEVGAGRRLSITFVATSERAESDEFWKYETAVDIDSWQSLLVRDTLRYGRRDRSKTFDLEDLEVTDVLSGLHLLRHSEVVREERRQLWSDGKVYSVMVVPEGKERRTINDGVRTLRKVSVEGVRAPGERRWRARAEIWFSDDDRLLPVELVYHQSLGRLRMILVGSSP